MKSWNKIKSQMSASWECIMLRLNWASFEKKNKEAFKQTQQIIWQEKKYLVSINTNYWKSPLLKVSEAQIEHKRLGRDLERRFSVSVKKCTINKTAQCF